jgi:hypothetical protein
MKCANTLQSFIVITIVSFEKDFFLISTCVPHVRAARAFLLVCTNRRVRHDEVQFL